ncbi:permease [Anaerotalea alkaliphila]|nr:permease [Anaerotalea alkaliphila]
MRYRAFLAALLAFGVLFLVNRELGMEALDITTFSLKEMLMVIPPIFVLLGLLDMWVPRETMVRYMGEESGFKGVLLAFLIGSAAAGPLYGAFPVAAVFMKKGVKFSNILIFIGAWSTTKIPLLIFEMTSLGLQFALTRLLVNIPGIILIAMLLSSFLSKKELDTIYASAEQLNMG